MDTQQGAAVKNARTAADVQRGLHTIKTAMPNVYEAIKAEAGAIGQGVYALVRRGLRGEPMCFWAMEAGHVVGTPFNGSAAQDLVASNMVQFGCAHVCMFGDLPAAEGGVRHGAA